MKIIVIFDGSSKHRQTTRCWLIGMWYSLVCAVIIVQVHSRTLQMRFESACLPLISSNRCSVWSTETKTSFHSQIIILQLTQYNDTLLLSEWFNIEMIKTSWRIEVRDLLLITLIAGQSGLCKPTQANRNMMNHQQYQQYNYSRQLPKNNGNLIEFPQ